jgi:HEPN domain-containing protein
VAKELKEILALWQIKAEHDLKIACKEIKVANPLTDIICFHAQQTAEKYLKMYLVSKGTEPLKTHSIKDLLNKCQDYSKNFEILKKVVFLTEYAVEARYPDDFYMPSINEAKEAIAAAKKVKELVIKLI